MASIADQVNNLTKTVADLNDQIAKVSAVTGQPNDLLDQRDGAVRELTALIGADGASRLSCPRFRRSRLAGEEVLEPCTGLEDAFAGTPAPTGHRHVNSDGP